MQIWDRIGERKYEETGYSDEAEYEVYWISLEFYGDILYQKFIWSMCVYMSCEILADMPRHTVQHK